MLFMLGNKLVSIMPGILPYPRNVIPREVIVDTVRSNVADTESVLNVASYTVLE